MATSPFSEDSDDSFMSAGGELSTRQYSEVFPLMHNSSVPKLALGFVNAIGRTEADSAVDKPVTAPHQSKTTGPNAYKAPARLSSGKIPDLTSTGGHGGQGGPSKSRSTSMPRTSGISRENSQNRGRSNSLTNSGTPISADGLHSEPVPRESRARPHSAATASQKSQMPPSSMPHIQELDATERSNASVTPRGFYDVFVPKRAGAKASTDDAFEAEILPVAQAHSRGNSNNSLAVKGTSRLDRGRLTQSMAAVELNLKPKCPHCAGTSGDARQRRLHLRHGCPFVVRDPVRTRALGTTLKSASQAGLQPSKGTIRGAGNAYEASAARNPLGPSGYRIKQPYIEMELISTKPSSRTRRSQPVAIVSEGEDFTRQDGQQEQISQAVDEAYHNRGRSGVRAVESRTWTQGGETDVSRQLPLTWQASTLSKLHSRKEIVPASSRRDLSLGTVRKVNSFAIAPSARAHSSDRGNMRGLLSPELLGKLTDTSGDLDLAAGVSAWSQNLRRGSGATRPADRRADGIRPWRSAYTTSDAVDFQPTQHFLPAEQTHAAYNLPDIGADRVLQTSSLRSAEKEAKPYLSPSADPQTSRLMPATPAQLLAYHQLAIEQLSTSILLSKALPQPLQAVATSPVIGGASPVETTYALNHAEEMAYLTLLSSTGPQRGRSMSAHEAHPAKHPRALSATAPTGSLSRQESRSASQPPAIKRVPSTPGLSAMPFPSSSYGRSLAWSPSVEPVAKRRSKATPRAGEHDFENSPSAVSHMSPAGPVSAKSILSRHNGPSTLPSNKSSGVQTQASSPFAEGSLDDSLSQASDSGADSDDSLLEVAYSLHEVERDLAAIAECIPVKQPHDDDPAGGPYHYEALSSNDPSHREVRARNRMATLIAADDLVRDAYRIKAQLPLKPEDRIGQPLQSMYVNLRTAAQRAVLNARKALQEEKVELRADLAAEAAKAARRRKKRNVFVQVEDRPDTTSHMAQDASSLLRVHDGGYLVSPTGGNLRKRSMLPQVALPRARSPSPDSGDRVSPKPTGIVRERVIPRRMAPVDLADEIRSVMEPEAALVFSYLPRPNSVSTGQAGSSPLELVVASLAALRQRTTSTEIEGSSLLTSDVPYSEHARAVSTISRAITPPQSDDATRERTPSPEACASDDVDRSAARRPNALAGLRREASFSHPKHSSRPDYPVVSELPAPLGTWLPSLSQPAVPAMLAQYDPTLLAFLSTLRQRSRLQDLQTARALEGLANVVFARKNRFACGDASSKLDDAVDLFSLQSRARTPSPFDSQRDIFCTLSSSVQLLKQGYRKEPIPTDQKTADIHKPVIVFSMSMEKLLASAASDEKLRVTPPGPTKQPPISASSESAFSVVKHLVLASRKNAAALPWPPRSRPVTYEDRAPSPPALLKYSDDIQQHIKQKSRGARADAVEDVTTKEFKAYDERMHNAMLSLNQMSAEPDDLPSNAKDGTRGRLREALGRAATAVSKVMQLRRAMPYELPKDAEWTNPDVMKRLCPAGLALVLANTDPLDRGSAGEIAPKAYMEKCAQALAGVESCERLFNEVGAGLISDNAAALQRAQSKAETTHKNLLNLHAADQADPQYDEEELKDMARAQELAHDAQRTGKELQETLSKLHAECSDAVKARELAPRTCFLPAPTFNKLGSFHNRVRELRLMADEADGLARVLMKTQTANQAIKLSVAAARPVATPVLPMLLRLDLATSLLKITNARQRQADLLLKSTEERIAALKINPTDSTPTPFSPARSVPVSRKALSRFLSASSPMMVRRHTEAEHGLGTAHTRVQEAQMLRRAIISALLGCVADNSNGYLDSIVVSLHSADSSFSNIAAVLQLDASNLAPVEHFAAALDAATGAAVSAVDMAYPLVVQFIADLENVIGPFEKTPSKIGIAGIAKVDGEIAAEKIRCSKIDVRAIPNELAAYVPARWAASKLPGKPAAQLTTQGNSTKIVVRQLIAADSALTASERCRAALKPEFPVHTPLVTVFQTCLDAGKAYDSGAQKTLDRALDAAAPKKADLDAVDDSKQLLAAARSRMDAVKLPEDLDAEVVQLLRRMHSCGVQAIYNSGNALDLAMQRASEGTVAELADSQIVAADAADLASLFRATQDAALLDHQKRKKLSKLMTQGASASARLQRSSTRLNAFEKNLNEEIRNSVAEPTAVFREDAPETGRLQVAIESAGGSIRYAKSLEDAATPSATPSKNDVVDADAITNFVLAVAKAEAAVEGVHELKEELIRQKELSDQAHREIREAEAAAAATKKSGGKGRLARAANLVKTGLSVSKPSHIAMLSTSLSALEERKGSKSLVASLTDPPSATKSQNGLLAEALGTKMSNSRNGMSRSVQSIVGLPSIQRASQENTHTSTQLVNDLNEALARLKSISAHYRRLVTSMRDGNMSTLPVDIGKPLKDALISATKSIRAADSMIPDADSRVRMVLTKAFVSDFNDAVQRSSTGVFNFERAFREAQRQVLEHVHKANKRTESFRLTTKSSAASLLKPVMHSAPASATAAATQSQPTLPPLAPSRSVREMTGTTQPSKAPAATAPSISTVSGSTGSSTTYLKTTSKSANSSTTISHSRDEDEDEENDFKPATAFSQAVTQPTLVSTPSFSHQVLSTTPAVTSVPPKSPAKPYVMAAPIARHAVDDDDDDNDFKGISPPAQNIAASSVKSPVLASQGASLSIVRRSEEVDDDSEDDDGNDFKATTSFTQTSAHTVIGTPLGALKNDIGAPERVPAAVVAKHSSQDDDDDDNDEFRHSFSAAPAQAPTNHAETSASMARSVQKHSSSPLLTAAAPVQQISSTLLVKPQHAEVPLLPPQSMPALSTISEAESESDRSDRSALVLDRSAAAMSAVPRQLPPTQAALTPVQAVVQSSATLSTKRETVVPSLALQAGKTSSPAPPQSTTTSHASSKLASGASPQHTERGRAPSTVSPSSESDDDAMTGFKWVPSGQATVPLTALERAAAPNHGTAQPPNPALTATSTVITRHTFHDDDDDDLSDLPVPSPPQHPKITPGGKSVQTSLTAQNIWSPGSTRMRSDEDGTSVLDGIDVGEEDSASAVGVFVSKVQLNNLKLPRNGPDVTTHSLVPNLPTVQDKKEEVDWSSDDDNEGRDMMRLRVPEPAQPATNSGKFDKGSENERVNRSRHHCFRGAGRSTTHGSSSHMLRMESDAGEGERDRRRPSKGSQQGEHRRHLNRSDSRASSGVHRRDSRHAETTELRRESKSRLQRTRSSRSPGGASEDRYADSPSQRSRGSPVYARERSDSRRDDRRDERKDERREERRDDRRDDRRDERKDERRRDDRHSERRREPYDSDNHSDISTGRRNKLRTRQSTSEVRETAQPTVLTRRGTHNAFASISSPRGDHGRDTDRSSPVRADPAAVERRERTERLKRLMSVDSIDSDLMDKKVVKSAVPLDFDPSVRLSPRNREPELDVTAKPRTLAGTMSSMRLNSQLSAELGTERIGAPRDKTLLKSASSANFGSSMMLNRMTSSAQLNRMTSSAQLHSSPSFAVIPSANGQRSLAAAPSFIMGKAALSPRNMAAAVGTAGLKGVIAPTVTPRTREPASSTVARFALNDNEIRLTKRGGGFMAHRAAAAESMELQAALGSGPVSGNTATGAVQHSLPKSMSGVNVFSTSSPPLPRTLTGGIQALQRQATAVSLLRKTLTAGDGRKRAITPPPNIKRGT